MQEYFIITSYQSSQRQQPVDQRLILTNELIASAENQSEKQEHLPLQKLSEYYPVKGLRTPAV